MIKKIEILVTATLILFSSIIISGCTETSNDGGENFKFTTIDGQDKYLSDFYGKIIILDLMGVNCQPCWYQLLALKQISENYSSNVAIISIDVWVPQETVEDVRWLINHFKQEFDLELDWTFSVDYSNRSIGKKYNPEGTVPALYIFDKKGNIYYTHVGYMEYSALSTKIKELLE
jgi:hypothetical protein